MTADPAVPPGRRRVLLVAHTGRSDIEGVVAGAQRKLADGGLDLVAVSDELPRLPRFDPEQPAGIEAVLALGGDGTFLRAAEYARTLGVGVIGVNLGRVGFLAEVDAEHIDTALSAIIDRDYRTVDRMTVDVSVVVDGEQIHTGWALNEISVEKSTRERVLDVVVKVDGRGLSAFGCDGVLVSTPTGSTAYAFSAGGPVVWPGVAALLVVPLNAHALFARPAVVGPDSVVTVQLDPEGHPGVLACDGRRTFDLPPGAEVHVRRGETSVSMIRVGDQAFTDRLVRKFALPAAGWRDQRH